MEAAYESQEERINRKIVVKKEHFSSSMGIFVDTYKGNLTDIVRRFNQKSQLDGSIDPSSGLPVEQSLNEKLTLIGERD